MRCLIECVLSWPRMSILFSRFAVLAVGLTAQQSYDRSTFHWRGNNAVTQFPLHLRRAGGATPTRDGSRTTLSWR